MNTEIKSCSCKHKYQDEKYGKDNRVFNKGKGITPIWRCTVCTKERV